MNVNYPDPTAALAETPLFGDKWIALDSLSDMRPQLLVIVDTEEEFDWNKPFDRLETNVDSMRTQKRMHEIFDRYGVQPTYVMDYSIASQPEGYEPLRELLDAGACNIGAHLHPWVNPPFEEVVSEVHSYPGNLAPDLELRKLEILTDTITQNLGQRPQIYKAGRYGLGPETFRSIRKLDYTVDLSPVPHYDMRALYGPDFTRIRPVPYWIDTPGSLLTVPLTRGFFGLLQQFGPAIDAHLEQPFYRMLPFRRMLASTRLFERSMLTPEGITVAEYTKLVAAMISSGTRVFSLTYHSPSVVPGNTPHVRSAADLQTFLASVDKFLETFLGKFGGEATNPVALREKLLRRPPLTPQGVAGTAPARS